MRNEFEHDPVKFYECYNWNHSFYMLRLYNRTEEMALVLQLTQVWSQNPHLGRKKKKTFVISATGNLASSLTSSGACIQVHILQHTPTHTHI